MAESGPILALISILPTEFLKLRQINSADDSRRDGGRSCLGKKLAERRAVARPAQRCGVFNQSSLSDAARINREAPAGRSHVGRPFLYGHTRDGNLRDK